MYTEEQSEFLLRHLLLSIFIIGNRTDMHKFNNFEGLDGSYSEDKSDPSIGKKPLFVYSIHPNL
jgi:hypothetical protein